MPRAVLHVRGNGSSSRGSPTSGTEQRMRSSRSSDQQGDRINCTREGVEGGLGGVGAGGERGALHGSRA